jgi:Ribbon-helix-helix domain
LPACWWKTSAPAGLAASQSRRNYVPIRAIKKSSRQRRKRVTTTIYLDPEQAEALKRLQEATKVPTAVCIREAIDMMLTKYSKKRADRR